MPARTARGARDKGREAENAVVAVLRNLGFEHSERRRLRGQADAGDIAGIPGVCIEVKAADRRELTAWLRETERERIAARADVAVLIMRRPRIPADQWTAVSWDTPFTLSQGSHAAAMAVRPLVAAVEATGGQAIGKGFAVMPLADWCAWMKGDDW